VSSVVGEGIECVTLFAADKERRQPRPLPQCFTAAVASCSQQMEAAREMFGRGNVVEILRSTDLRQTCKYVIS